MKSLINNMTNKTMKLNSLLLKQNTIKKNIVNLKSFKGYNSFSSSTISDKGAYVYNENYRSKTVVVGISGGVDSSTSAYLLKEAGYNVIGLYMKNWDASDEHGIEECPAESDFKDVKLVCDYLNVPVHRVNFVKEYWQEVFTPFIEGYENGLTPNPDVLCNKQIKFNKFLDKAKELGADYVATGHYVRTIDEYDENSSTKEKRIKLLCGLDPGKDQSYFLSFVNTNALRNVLFPVGNMHKEDVRKIAKEAGLPTADKKDSYGICFIGKRDFRDFIDGYIHRKPGYFRNVENINEIVGTHESCVFYTIGQQSKISGAQQKWYVCDKDYFTNDVIVAKGRNHPSLYCNYVKLNTTNFHWVNNNKPPSKLVNYDYDNDDGGEMKGMCRIRHRQSLTSCTFKLKGAELIVYFDSPQYAATPGQVCALYCTDGIECYGGGIIEEKGESYYEMGYSEMVDIDKDVGNHAF